MMDLIFIAFRISLRLDLKCVFIDDTEANVIGAEKLGMNGIVFTGYEDAVEKLGKFLIKSKEWIILNRYSYI